MFQTRTRTENPLTTDGPIKLVCTHCYSVYQSQIVSDSIDSQLPYRKDNWRLCFGIRTRGSSRTHDGVYHSSPFCEPEGFRVEKLGDKCECVHMYHGCGFS